jgi:hypothetical protein
MNEYSRKAAKPQSRKEKNFATIGALSDHRERA